MIRASKAKRPPRRAGFVLVEVLLSMTILAIAGTSLLRSIQNSVDASRKARVTAKEVFLAKAKLHEYELAYTNKPLGDLGRFDGNFGDRGESEYVWQAEVGHDRNRDAYVITVWVNKREPAGRAAGFDRRQYRGNPGFMLRTLAPVARYNELIMRGYAPGMRGERRGRR